MRPFLTPIYDVRMFFCNRLRMEVQVCGHVWTGKNDVMRLHVDTETFENGQKSLCFQVYPDTCGRGLRTCLHLVPEHSVVRARLSSGINVNTPGFFFQGPTPEFGHMQCPCPSTRSRPCTQALKWVFTSWVPSVWTQHHFVLVPRHYCSGTKCEHGLSLICVSTNSTPTDALHLLVPYSAMHTTMDTTKKDMGPILNNSTEYAIYYITFVVVFSFFFLNIFVALIILTFQEEGEKEIANCELDRNQVTCYTLAWWCSNIIESLAKSTDVLDSRTPTGSHYFWIIYCHTNGKQPLVTSVACQTRQRMRIDCNAEIVASGWRPWIQNVRV